VPACKPCGNNRAAFRVHGVLGLHFQLDMLLLLGCIHRDPRHCLLSFNVHSMCRFGLESDVPVVRWGAVASIATLEFILAVARSADATSTRILRTTLLSSGIVETVLQLLSGRKSSLGALLSVD
jgi:hypothetical protein